MKTEVILKDVKTIEELDAQREAFLEKMRLEDAKYLEKRCQLVNEERERRQKEAQDWCDNLTDEIWEGYNVGPKEVAKLIVDRAWETGHSLGYYEVRCHAESLAEYTEKVVKITERNVRIKKNGSD